MAEEVADQGAVIGDLLGAFAVADACGLDDGAVVAHTVDETDKAIVEDGELLPAELIDGGGHGGSLRERSWGIGTGWKMEPVRKLDSGRPETEFGAPGIFRLARCAFRSRLWEGWSSVNREKGPIVS